MIISFDSPSRNGGGVTSYEALTDKPKINGHELKGDLTSADLDILESLGYDFIGIATPTTEPIANTTRKYYYLATDEGTYTKFNNIIVNKGEIALLLYDTAWSKVTVASNSFIEKTYNELKTLRDENKLIPGSLYRITDYTATTVTVGTTSANHLFDIIIMATSPCTLSESVKATHHKDDTYFANNNLDAWEIKYSFDNDENKYAWAFARQPKKVIVWGSTYGRYPAGDDISHTYGICWKGTYMSVYSATENPVVNVDEFAMGSPGETGLRVATSIIEPTTTEGKGVIYQMTDEFGNTCPYDFKNIQFHRKWDANLEGWTITNVDGIPAYTFSDDGGSTATSFNDNSLNGLNKITNNTIKPWISYNGLNLNNICFFGTELDNNKFEYNCRNSTILRYTSNNTIRDDCYNINILGTVSQNTIGVSNHNITLYQYARYNTSGAGCYNIAFHSNADDNIIGNACYDITLNTGCYGNVIDNDIRNLTLSEGCVSNTFQSGSSDITLGESCSYNIFNNTSGYITLGNNSGRNIFDQNTYDCVLGKNCSYNTININSRRITMGDYCSNNIFHNDCTDIKLGTQCTDNIFYTGCSNIILAADATGTVGDFFKNNIFDVKLEYVTIYNTEVADYSHQVTNYHFKTAISGTWQSIATIEVARDNVRSLVVDKNSNNKIKYISIADKDIDLLTSIPTTGIKTNNFYELGTITDATLNIPIETPTDFTIDNEWGLSFDIGDTVVPTIIFPTNASFVTPPNWVKNNHYEVSIKWDNNNSKYYVIIQSWAN